MLCIFDTGIITVSGNMLTWKINKFFNMPLNVGDEIRSPQFAFGDSLYTLVIWPRGHKSYGVEGWFGICLYKYNDKRCTGPAMFSIGNNYCVIKSSTVKCSENGVYKDDKFMQWAEFRILRKIIARNDILTIVCKMPAGVHTDCEDQESVASK